MKMNCVKQKNANVLFSLILTIISTRQKFVYDKFKGNQEKNYEWRHFFIASYKPGN
jgi:hypothetical protein